MCLHKFCRYISFVFFFNRSFVTCFVVLLTKFQVKTKLENPTRYHVIQKQKNQVKQYLSESYKQSHNWSDQAPDQISNDEASELPPLRQASSYTPLQQNQVPATIEQKSQSYEYGKMMHIQNQTLISSNGANTAPHSSSTNGAQFYFSGRFSNVTASPSESAMSPSISSVATSASEVSEIFYLLN